MNLPPLVVGSPTARALHSIMSGAPATVLVSDGDLMDLTVEVWARLFGYGSSKSFEFPIQRENSLPATISTFAEAFRRRGLPVDMKDWPVMWVPNPTGQWNRVATRMLPDAPPPPKDLPSHPDLVVIGRRWLPRLPQLAGWARLTQILLVTDRPGPYPQLDGAALGANADLWHGMPPEVALAGGPS